MHYSINTHHIRCITHADSLFLRHREHSVESIRHFFVKALDNFVPAPVEIHVILNAFEIGNGYATGITEEIRNDEHITAVENNIRLGRCRPIGTFRDDSDLLADGFDRLRIDLAFKGSRNEDIYIFAEPCVGWFYFIAGISGLVLIDRSIDICDVLQEDRVDAVLLEESVGLFILSIPA